VPITSWKVEGWVRSSLAGAAPGSGAGTCMNGDSSPALATRKATRWCDDATKSTIIAIT
jgi:hypothetical protein